MRVPTTPRTRSAGVLPGDDEYWINIRLSHVACLVDGYTHVHSFARPRSVAVGDDDDDDR
jgi:hypothetical protein